MKSIVYSLRTIDGNSTLSIDLTGKIILEDNQSVNMLLSSKDNTTAASVILQKSEYLNTPHSDGKIYDDGKQFFIVANKQLNRRWAFEKLMRYAITKIDSRMEVLSGLKAKYTNELSSVMCA